jgi:formylglycine-generating enzyme required for sulfatase activity
MSTLTFLRNTHVALKAFLVLVVQTSCSGHASHSSGGHQSDSVTSPEIRRTKYRVDVANRGLHDARIFRNDVLDGVAPLDVIGTCEEFRVEHEDFQPFNLSEACNSHTRRSISHGTTVLRVELLPKHAKTATPDPRCPASMVFIEGGDFSLGETYDNSRNRQPRHVVPASVPSFCMHATEVTVGSYRACVSASYCKPAHDEVDWDGITADQRKAWSTFCHTADSDAVDHPQNCVDWYDASSFCHFVGGRLPTDYQWEFAAKGPEKSSYPWGVEMPTSFRLNICDESCRESLKPHNPLSSSWNDESASTSPVGAYPLGNSFHGLTDMSGNVWEWVDVIQPANSNVSSASSSTKQELRGGGWDGAMPSYIRTTNSRLMAPKYRASSWGFRCVKNPIVVGEN